MQPRLASQDNRLLPQFHSEGTGIPYWQAGVTPPHSPLSKGSICELRVRGATLSLIFLSLPRRPSPSLPRGTFSQLPRPPLTPKGLFMLRQCINGLLLAHPLFQQSCCLSFVRKRGGTKSSNIDRPIFAAFPLKLFSIFLALALLLFPPFQLNFLINIFPHPSPLVSLRSSGREEMRGEGTFLSISFSSSFLATEVG